MPDKKIPLVVSLDGERYGVGLKGEEPEREMRLFGLFGDWVNDRRLRDDFTTPTGQRIHQEKWTRGDGQTAYKDHWELGVHK